ncbi:MAG: hypothetical protein OXK21_07430 [Chloroflexota bacterium]|nr:hypothetical protein [Chloroflexota bacterium]
MFFLDAPGLETLGLHALFGTIYALLLVVIIQGSAMGTNIMKGMFAQSGGDIVEDGRPKTELIRAYFRTWAPLLMPTLVLLAALNFVFAAGAISSILLLASRDTATLSILALELASPYVGQGEEASIVSLIMIMLTVGPVMVAWAFCRRLGIRHEQQATVRQVEASQAGANGVPPTAPRDMREIP